MHVEPTSYSSHLMKRRGLLSARHQDGLAVYYEDGREECFRPSLDDAGADTLLNFTISSRDPYFSLYTSPVVRQSGQIFYFDSGYGVQEYSGRIRLHGESFVSASDVKAWDDISLHDHLFRENKLALTGIFITIRLEDVFPGVERNDTGIEYVLRFQPAESIWKYFLFGELANLDMRIIDLDNLVVFDQSEAVLFPGGINGATFVSTAPIPMRETPERRFQLQEKRNRGDKTIMKRLPNASVDRLGRDVKDGKGVFVSEIYVNF
jgi:hypothetical protein